MTFRGHHKIILANFNLANRPMTSSISVSSGRQAQKRQRISPREGNTQTLWDLQIMRKFYNVLVFCDLTTCCQSVVTAHRSLNGHVSTREPSSDRRQRPPYSQYPKQVSMSKSVDSSQILLNNDRGWGIKIEWKKYKFLFLLGCYWIVMRGVGLW